MFDSWKKKKATNYLEKEILRLSLGTQELLKKWLMDDLSKYGELSPDKYEEELRKFYAGVSAALTVELRRDFSDAAAEKLIKCVADFSKENKVTGDFLFLFAYGAVTNMMPTDDVDKVGKSIVKKQMELVKNTTAEVLEDWDDLYTRNKHDSPVSNEYVNCDMDIDEIQDFVERICEESIDGNFEISREDALLFVTKVLNVDYKDEAIQNFIKIKDMLKGKTKNVWFVQACLFLKIMSANDIISEREMDEYCEVMQKELLPNS